VQILQLHPSNVEMLARVARRVSKEDQMLAHVTDAGRKRRVLDTLLT
jgi:hypothetical protein